jgi:hypothetical protein
VIALGLVVRPPLDPHSEQSAALITRYVEHSFSYRELLSGPGFGPRRIQLLDVFAGLLAELHLLGCYWGDCSFSNVLYRYDAGAIEVTLVDAETSEIHPELSDGQRRQDIEIMIENAGAEMVDIAASHDVGGQKSDQALQIDFCPPTPCWRSASPASGPRNVVADEGPLPGRVPQTAPKRASPKKPAPQVG